MPNQRIATTPQPTDHVLERARRYLLEMPASISGQHGHDRLFAAACRLVKGFNLSTEAALPILNEYNERAQPPWEQPDLIRKLEQADASHDDRPRGYLLVHGETESSTRADTVHEVLPILSGPRFPAAIPDFIPVPVEYGLGHLSIDAIERRPGRPKFEFDSYVQWQILSGAYGTKKSPVFIPDNVFSAGVVGATLRREVKIGLK